MPSYVILLTRLQGPVLCNSQINLDKLIYIPHSEKTIVSSIHLSSEILALTFFFFLYLERRKRSFSSNQKISLQLPIFQLHQLLSTWLSTYKVCTPVPHWIRSIYEFRGRLVGFLSFICCLVE